MKSDELKELMNGLDMEQRSLMFVQKLFDSVKDQGGFPYLNHLLRVRDKFQDPFLRSLGLLHDVLEDTSLTVKDLKELGYSFDFIQVLLLLTKDRSVSYHDYISKIIESKNDFALLVKIADMEDNMQEERLQLLEDSLAERLRRKYEPEMVRLIKEKEERNLC